MFTVHNMFTIHIDIETFKNKTIYSIEQCKRYIIRSNIIYYVLHHDVNIGPYESLRHAEEVNTWRLQVLPLSQTPAELAASDQAC